MKKVENEEASWAFCTQCKGLGKKSRKTRKQVRLRNQMAFNLTEKTIIEDTAPIRPKVHLYSCLNCSGSGLIHSTNPPIADKENYPHIAIVGAGIGGVALAVACLHRGIPFTLYERDNNFDARSQGYGLTLQQGSNVIKGLGIFSLEEGVISTKHVVHTTEGKVIVEWGRRMIKPSAPIKSPKRTNIHIARQDLRLTLLKQLGGINTVQWGHQLVDFKESEDRTINLSFQVNGEIKSAKANLLVGADGIRSAVRSLLIGENITPLRYLGYQVILGICPLEKLKGLDHPLLDSSTVFQTVNGSDRIYVMPYSSDTVMWQLSFPMPEKEALSLSAHGAKALKEEACRRTPWHDPIPQIIAATQDTLISGYPVYDREILKTELLEKSGAVTLIGDAAHPMSPFKGQGANQALLDALAMARAIAIHCSPLTQWREIGIRKSVLTEFETEMLERSAIKVKDSAEAAKLLHSNMVLREGNEQKGRSLKAEDE